MIALESSSDRYERPCMLHAATTGSFGVSECTQSSLKTTPVYSHSGHAVMKFRKSNQNNAKYQLDPTLWRDGKNQTGNIQILNYSL